MVKNGIKVGTWNYYIALVSLVTPLMKDGSSNIILQN